MFYERLTGLCADFHISLTALVTKELKMSVSNVTKWKNGNVPKSDTVSAIASYFNVSTDYLLGKTDIKNKPTANKDSELIKAEAELLELFRNVPEENQSLVLEMIEAALKNQGLLK